MNLERLDEALSMFPADQLPDDPTAFDHDAYELVAAAARAHRDLLANGERVWVCQHNRGGERLCREVHAYDPSLHATCGWRLLVDPTTEGER